MLQGTVVIHTMKQENVKKRTGIRRAILILSALLAVNVAALAGIQIWRAVAPGKSAVVTVPDNIISSGSQVIPVTEPATEDTPVTEPATEPAPSEMDATSETDESSTTPQESATPTSETNPPARTAAQSSSSGGQREAAVISLYRNHAEDNQPFQVANMFPGDLETKYYCVKVSHSGDVIVHHRANVRPGYEKLAEVLRCRTVLLTTGETLYDGLMRDMPQSLTHGVKATERTETELYYEITAYLDTSVGNDYQNKELIADFSWWVEDTGSLDSPDTSDPSRICLWVCIASGSLLILLCLVWPRRREERENG